MWKTLSFVSLAVMLGGGLRLSAETLPSTAIENCRYLSRAAAQAAWRPMGGTAGVELINIQGRAALRMPCHFRGTADERASWDRTVALDLSSARGVRLQVWCKDPSPVSHFSLYFKSGPGWYHVTFYPESNSQWNEITLDKTATQMEGAPAGWGKIDAIRISAWRSGKVDTEFFLGGISRIGELGVDASVAVLRADSAAGSAGDGDGIKQSAERVCASLNGLGIGCALLSDLDATPEKLRNAKMVVLPYNASMPEPVARMLVEYLAQGGKLMAFYTVPPLLRGPLGIRGGDHVRAPTPGAFAKIRFLEGALTGAPAEVEQQSWNINAYEPVPGAGRVLAEWADASGTSSGRAALIASSNGVVMTHILLPGDLARKDRMMLALTGYLIPEVWPEAARATIGKIGAFSNYQTFEEAVRGILAQDHGAKVTAAVNQARELRAAALRASESGRHWQAMDQAREAAKNLQDGFCLAQKPLRGEFRAFWCHSAFGVQGMNWDAAVKRLADNGFTAVLPNMLWGGVAFYPSGVLPVAASVASRGDQVAACLEAGKKYGVQVHVWKVNWNLGTAAPKDFVDRMRRENRLQRGLDGNEEPWLCPSHPANQELEVASLVEVVRKYPVAGIHFDYIRYPDGSHCFCAGCRERFGRAQAGLKTWPKDVLPGGGLREQWLEWRRSNITTVVRETSTQARAARRGIKLSAAVFRNWPSDRDSVGQDWKVWCDQGYLDFVCPMDYTESNRGFENMVRQQREWAGRVPCYPGIGVSASSSSFGVEKVIEQILITREHHTQGFVIFNYAVPESRTLLPLLGLGITRER